MYSRNIKPIVCDPRHSFYDAPVYVYAVVSDGTLEVTSEVRTLIMPGVN